MERLFDGRKDIVGMGKGEIHRLNHLWDWTTAFERHLEGWSSHDLGIYLVRDDNTVTFAAVDIDEPDFELAKMIATLLPTENAWIERSRSGNYHVFVFFDEPLEAWCARAVLRATTMAAGRRDLEIFPKQDALKEGMVGNYISIPWHGEERPIVWGGRGGWGGESDGDAMLRSIFLRSALMNLTSAEEWRRRARKAGGRPPEERERTSQFGEQGKVHVCADYIIDHMDDNPVVQGHRATVYFNLAKMYLNAGYEKDEVLYILEGVNERSPDPVAVSELQRFVNNAERGRWTSTGCDMPEMMPYVSPECPIANG